MIDMYILIPIPIEKVEYSSYLYSKIFGQNENKFEQYLFVFLSLYNYPFL